MFLDAVLCNAWKVLRVHFRKYVSFMFFFNYDLILYLSSIRNIKLQVNWEERINFWGKNKYCHIMGLLPQILDKNVFFSLWSAR